MKNKLLNISQLKNNFKKGITPLLCALTIFNICGINVNAASVVSFPFPEPLVDDYNGYLVVSRDDGYYHLIWFTFNPIVQDYGNNTQSIPLSLRTQATYDSSSGNVHLSFSALCRGNLSVYHWSSYSETVSYVYYESLNQGVSYGTDVRIVGTLDSIYAKGNFINNNFGGVSTPSDIYISWGSDSSIYSELERINNTLWVVNTNIGGKLDISNDTLQDIYDRLGLLLNQSSNGSIQDVPTTEINSVENKENALIGSNPSTSDLSVTINPTSASVVWGLIDNLVTGNQKVFTMFISILTIGVIGLILNR